MLLLQVLEPAPAVMRELRDQANAEAFIDEARPMLARLREEGVLPGTRID